MNTVYELLAQKERDLSRVHKEVECLRIAAILLSDEADEHKDEHKRVSEREPLVTAGTEDSVGAAEAGTPEESTVQRVMGMFRKRPA